MSLSDTIESARPDSRVLALALLALCVAGGVLTAYVGVLLPLLLALALFGLFAMGGLTTVFGLRGALIFLPLATAFLLMQRFDQGLAINLGEVAFRGFFLFITLFWLALLAVSFIPNRDIVTQPVYQRISAGYLLLFLAFLTTALLGIATNFFFDPYVIRRHPGNELLALYTIVLPMLFVPVLMRAAPGLSKTELALHALVGLGGLAGLIMSAFGILPGQVLGLLGWSTTTQGTADLVRGRLPLGHPNHVASVMNMLMPPAIIYGLLGRKPLFRALNLSCAALMLCGVLFTLSRGALLNLLIVIAITLAYALFAKENRRWYAAPLVAGAACVMIAIAMALLATYDFSRFWSTDWDENASANRRLDSMYTATVVFRDHPLLGVSPDAVYNRIDLRPEWEPRFDDRISPIFFYRGHVTAETPHNLYLTLFAEFGIFGAPLFLALLAMMLAVLWRMRNRPELDLYDRRMMTAYAIGVGAFLLSGMFEAVPIAAMRVGVIFWIYCGLALAFGLLALKRDTPDTESDG